jgi:hypothetical protein
VIIGALQNGHKPHLIAASWDSAHRVSYKDHSRDPARNAARLRTSRHEGTLASE